MTQMLLFDSITAGSISTDTAVSPIVSVTPVSAVVTPSLRESSKRAASRTEIPEPHTRGLNHIGDLARLVLLRHDLVAAQRTQRRSNRRAK